MLAICDISVAVRDHWRRPKEVRGVRFRKPRPESNERVSVEDDREGGLKETHRYFRCYHLQGDRSRIAQLSHLADGGAFTANAVVLIFSKFAGSHRAESLHLHRLCTLWRTEQQVEAPATTANTDTDERQAAGGATPVFVCAPAAVAMSKGR